MAITLLIILTDYQSSVITERELNFQQNPYNIFHHNFSMSPH